VAVDAAEVAGGPTEEEIRQVVDELEAQRKREARQALSLELANEAPKAPVAQQALVQGVEPGAQPPDVWTLSTMRKRGLLTADLYGDGKFLFQFDGGVLESEYAQVRFDRAYQYFRDRDAKKPETTPFSAIMQGYADVIYRAIRRGSWPVMEEVDNPDDPDSPMLVPLARTRENVGELDWEQLMAFVQAMTRAIRGEVNGQP
jgi:hypothetical protein